MANAQPIDLEDRRRRTVSDGVEVSVDLDQVVDALLDYVRARAHQVGARAWADMVSREHPDYLGAHRRHNEAAETAATRLHALGMALYPAVDDQLAHEAFVDDVDAAIEAGYVRGLDGHEPLELVGFDPEPGCDEGHRTAANGCTHYAGLVQPVDAAPREQVELRFLDGRTEHVDIAAAERVDVRRDLL